MKTKKPIKPYYQFNNDVLKSLNENWTRASDHAKILTVDNQKTIKGAKYGYKTLGIHFAPFTLSGQNICPWASKGCAAACLNTAGRGIFESIQKARIKKTQDFQTNRNKFLARLYREISNEIRAAEKAKIKLAFRLNLTSDLQFEKIALNHKSEQSIIHTFKDIQFYDYTKGKRRYENYLSGADSFPKNYHLTYSRAETSKLDYLKGILKRGGNVAIAFQGIKKDDPMIKTYKGYPVIDGDINDLRFKDQRGAWIGLRSKGKAKKDKTGFAVDPKS